MEPMVYVAPDGARQTAVTPVVAERLRASGWRPLAELVELSQTDETAREHLARADTYAAERKAEQNAREARYAPNRGRPAAAPPTPQPETGPEPEAPAKKRPAARS